MAGHGDNKKDDYCVPGEEIARGLNFFGPGFSSPMVFRVPVPRCLAFSVSCSATRFGFLHLAQRSTTRSYGEIHKRVAKLQYDGLPLGFNRGYVLMELILNGLNCGYADGTGWKRR